MSMRKKGSSKATHTTQKGSSRDEPSRSEAMPPGLSRRPPSRLSVERIVQTAMELAFNEGGSYPIIEAEVAEATNNDVEINTWDELAAFMSTYISQLPVAPNHDSVDSPEAYTYVVQTQSSVSIPDEYFLHAVLEDGTHAALSQDIDGIVGASGTFSGDYASINSQATVETDAVTTGASQDCEDTNANYCLGGNA